jgi:hypothetical protein
MGSNRYVDSGSFPAIENAHCYYDGIGRQFRLSGQFISIYKDPGALVFDYLIAGNIESLFALKNLFFSYNSGISLRFLRENNSPIRDICGVFRAGSLTLGNSSLPRVQSDPDQTEYDQPYLRPKRSSLQFNILVFEGFFGFSICTFLGVWILQYGTKNGDAPLKVYISLFIGVALVGQLYVFLVLRGLFER